MANGKPIFYDEQRRRWRRTRRVMDVTGAVITVVLVIFGIDVARVSLPALALPELNPALHAIKERKGAKKAPEKRPGRKRKVAALGKVPDHYDPLRAAFYVPWDSSSFAALQLHHKDIDVLMPEMLHAVSPDGRMDVEPDPKLASWMATPAPNQIELPIMPLLNNYDGRDWKIKEMAEMLAQPESRARLVSSLTTYLTANHNPGLVVDFEEVPEKSQPDFRKFVKELGAALHAAGLKLMVALPAADWSYDYAFFAAQADAIILMNYDQHWPSSEAGPIVSQDWFQRNLQNILKLVPADKLVMGIANYTYDWPAPTKKNRHPTAQNYSFEEAMVHALESEATIDFDSDSLNPHYSYSDENGVDHDVWMLDALTAYNELRAAERAGVRGTALWRLGTEDASLWDIWDAVHADDPTRQKLEDVTPGYDLILEGDGDIWRILSTPQDGRRTFDYEAATDTFTDESYTATPLSWRIQQMGAAPKKLALSFDDGPDPTWTPKILDVLEAKHVPAVFFVIGEEADKSPGIVQREYRDGMELGNHTYTHPKTDQVSTLQFRLELNLTQRLLASNLGIKTLLFRPPYGIDHQPEYASEVQLLPLPQEMGYLIVGARLDPHDWGEPNGGAPAAPEVIADRVQQDAEAGHGNIILLHDGGGNRSHTVAALPLIIDRLRAAGYEFVQVSDLLGQTRAQVMPPLTRNEWLAARADAFIFDLFHWFRLSIAYIFVAGIVLVSGRALIVGLLALVERMRPAPLEHPEYRPLVSVLIPAFNEEAAIVGTVGAALGSDYPKLEVIVVNDGSTDETSERVREHFGDDPRVHLIEQSNFGKPLALNRALADAEGEIVVTIDADTEVAPDAVRNLVRHFADAKVGAVAGNVKVRNRDRWITRWQALEYITSQNLEKRAFDLLNCIPVVPGAVGAWRADLMRRLGGFAPDTVAEDTDLTFNIRRQGWRILYDEDAIGGTEAPETADALVRQRLRWTFGTLQAVWKHRDTVGRWKYGTLGWIAIPNVFLFQILLPLVSPLIDLLFLGSLVLWGLAQFRVTRLPQLWTAQDVERSLIFFFAFMLIDLFTCVVAFVLEKHEDWSLLWPLLIQRFYYRQMMYVVLFRALFSAWKGRPVGWRGNVDPELPAHISRAPEPSRAP